MLPFQGIPQIWNTHTNFHKLEETTKTNSVQKDKLKNSLEISDIHPLQKA